MKADDFSLLLDFLADDLTADELAALSRRLKAEPRLAEQLLLLASDEARLVEWARVEAGKVTPASRARGHSDAGAPAPATAGRRAVGKYLPLLGGLVAVAAGVWGIYLTPLSAPSETPTAATDTLQRPSDALLARVVSESSGSDWYTESWSHQDQWSVHRGDTLHLNAGSLRLLFDHGTSVTLQAPAVLEVKDAMLARIHRGAIRVEVAKGAEGFSIDTPIARVVDLGTEFGVSVDDRGGTDVVVFKGAVDVEGRSGERGSASSAKRLTAGEAVRMDERGTTSRLVMVSTGRFPAGEGKSLERPPNTLTPIIERVSDNIERDGSFNFYEIVHSGMAEDAHAFVDRPDHQWNGVDRRGLPPYLKGGDYVRTFNDDKLNEDLRISLAVTRAADIYILLDDRATPPVWLREGFALATEKIGLDEGSGKYHDPGPDGRSRWIERPTGTGAGVSIDFPFSVWKRSVDQPGEVVLGPLGGSDWEVNMYGIVAVAKAGDDPTHQPLREPTRRIDPQRPQALPNGGTL